MKLLAVECSAGPASCVVAEDGRILAAASTHRQLTHSQTLMPMIAHMLQDALAHAAAHGGGPARQLRCILGRD